MFNPRRSEFPVFVPGAPEGGKTLEVVAPFDGTAIGSVATADREAVDRALAIAHDLYRDRGQWLPAAERIGILTRTLELMEEHVDALALEAAREGGKPLVDSRVETIRAIDSVRICIDTLRTEGGRGIPMGINAASAKHLAFTTHEPIGVVVAISAFNHPLNLIAHQVGPAIATGCPVIVKPAHDTPLSCFRFVEILREAGLPESWCQALVVEDIALAERLATDERVAFLSFIGSSRVGWTLRSKLAPGARCALEHGGVAPVIVCADADLDGAVPMLAKAGFYHAGQVCVSVQRVYADDGVAETLARRLGEVGDAMKTGDPTQEDTDVGPLIRAAEVDRVESWVNEAVDGGAQVIAGAKRLSDTCYAPTVLLDPPDDARVSTLEVFGPVVCVYRYKDVDNAIARANSLPVSFQSAVFTASLDTALHCYHRLDASAVMVNDHTAFRVDWMPFAGLRTSGHGVGGIPYTMHDMWAEKMMVVRSQEIID